MSGRSWWQLIFLVIFIFLSAIISYVRGYLEEQNDKKLERDAEDGNKKAKKLKKLLSDDRQKVFDALWVSQMLLLIVESGLVGFAFLAPIAQAFQNWFGIAKLLCTLLAAIVCTLVFGCVYMVVVRRIFSGIGTRRGRENGQYSTVVSVFDVGLN